MINTINSRVRLVYTKVALKIIVCGTMVGVVIFGANFCNLHVMAVRTKKTLVELDSDYCISIVWRARDQMKVQSKLPDGHNYSKDNLRLSAIVRVAEKMTLPAHSQKRILVQTP